MRGTLEMPRGGEEGKDRAPLTADLPAKCRTAAAN